MSIEIGGFEGVLGAFGESPTRSPAGEASFTQLCTRITTAFSRHQTIAGSIALLEQRGVNCATARSSHATWMESIKEAFRYICKVIKQYPAVQAAIDAAAAVVDYAKSIVGLEGADLEFVKTKTGAWRDIVRTLDPDRVEPGVGTRGELGWVALVVPAFQATWPLIAPVLLRALTVIGVYWATSNIASVVSSISGEVENRGDALEKCLNNAKKFTDKAQAQSALDACQKLAAPVSGFNWLLVGGAAGALGLLYLQNKKRG